MSNGSTIAESLSSSATRAHSEYRVIDFGHTVILFWRRRYLLVGAAVVGALLGAGAAAYVRPLYEATVRLMPPTQTESLFASLSGARNQGDLYLGLVNSRTVADDVIEHQHLADYFHTTNHTALRRALAGMAKVTTDKDQFVSITVRAPEGATAVRVANEFPRALYRLNHAVALSQAHHRWEFYEGPLQEEREKLAEAEDQLKVAQQQTGLVMPEAQVQLSLNAIAALNQQITSRREQLAGLEASSTSQNPQVIQLKSQIASLSGQLASLQAQNGGSAASHGSAKLPALTLEIERRARDVKYHQALFDILSKQYENARIDDSYSPSVELVDDAVMPDEKAWPPRKLFVLIGLVIGVLLAVALVCLQAFQPFARLRDMLREDRAVAAAGPRG